MIPKIIHQTWKTETIPEEWKDAADSCKRNHPDFKYILWTHETMDEFMKTHFPDYYKMYTSYKYDIQRCDAFRYFVLYTYGGIYLDLDIVCKKSLTDLLGYDLVFAPSSNVESFFTNSFFMSIPKHSFFKHCMDNLSKHANDYTYFGKHLHVMHSTGPAFITRIINEYGDIKKSYHLTRKEFSGDCTVCNENTCKGGAYFSHIKGNSWHGLDSTFYNFLLCNKTILVLFVFAFSLKYFTMPNKKAPR